MFRQKGPNVSGWVDRFLINDVQTITVLNWPTKREARRAKSYRFPRKAFELKRDVSEIIDVYEPVTMTWELNGSFTIVVRYSYSYMPIHEHENVRALYSNTGA